MHHEALPPIPILRLKCFLYDATADWIGKINKLVQFAPEIYSVACFLPKNRGGLRLRALSDFTDRRLIKKQRRPCVGTVYYAYLACCGTASSVGRGDMASGESHGWVEIEICTGIGYRNLSLSA
jgi:hypothetical protein